jgi:hypothetical protein
MWWTPPPFFFPSPQKNVRVLGISEDSEAGHKQYMNEKLVVQIKGQTSSFPATVRNIQSLASNKCKGLGCRIAKEGCAKE